MLAKHGCSAAARTCLTAAARETRALIAAQDGVAEIYRADVGDLAQTADIAGLVHFLLSDKGDLISGQTHDASGGLSTLP